MPLDIPLTQESIDGAISHLETSLNTSAPANKKAFLKVLGVLLGMQQTAHYKHGVERSKQNLALTATGDDLEDIGNDNDIFYKPAELFKCTGLWVGAEGSEIPVGAVLEQLLTGNFYICAQTTVIGVAGEVEIPIWASEYGPDWNLSTDAETGLNELSVVADIEGTEKIVLITAITQLGTEAETEEEYRIRVLDEQRSVGGGSNLGDYRKWGQAVSGVGRIYPYTGIAPEFEDSIPGYRTIFVQSTVAVDPDGIAPQPLLDAVRVDLNTDPDTGLSRPTLGSVDSQLNVESIYRTGFFFTVRGLTVSGSNWVDAKAAIDEALEAYARGRIPYVWGLDPEIDKDDVLTAAGASAAAQQAVLKYGGYISYVGVGKIAGQFLPPYQLAPGELGDLEQVDYEA